MVNPQLFKSRPGRHVAKADTKNLAGGKAYAFTDQHALAQYAVTGTFYRTYYASAKAKLDKTLELCSGVDPEFIAKVALYARQDGYMKDMPAFLCAYLAAKDTELLKLIFPRVMDNGTMVKKFAMILRSGVVGRKSFGTSVRNTIRRWLEARRDDALFRDSVGAGGGGKSGVSLADIIKMVHPKPRDEVRDALYGYLLGKKFDFEKLPQLVQEYEAFKRSGGENIPAVPFQFIASTQPVQMEEPKESDRDFEKRKSAWNERIWTQLAKDGPWHFTRMNIRNFMKRGVMDKQELVEMVAARLRDPDIVRKVKVFPYQLLVAFLMTHGEAPHEVTDALQDAMEIATENVPVVDGKVVVCPDVSGSMTFYSITGDRGSASSEVRPIHVAALVSAVFLRKNPGSRVLPFSGDVERVTLNSRDSIMTNAKKLASIGGGATNCAAPLQMLNREKAQADLVVYVSDNESWVDRYSGYQGSGQAHEWAQFKARNPKAKMVNIDVLASTTSTPHHDADDVLNVGGWSDNVFNIVNMFCDEKLGGEHLVKLIEQLDLQQAYQKPGVASKPE